MMSDLKLLIGDKNSSTWSLCAWLTLKQLGLEFEEVVIARERPDARERILQHSPSGKLPLLIAGQIKVWDSLAINEFLADHFDGLWPTGAAARAVARSVAAEAHSGFRDLHTFLPMDVTARFGPPGRLLSGVAADVRRLAAIWHDCRGRFGGGGPFLLGEFSVADAMMAPVCARLMTYAVPLDELCRDYVGHLVSLPAMIEWAEGAAAEVAASAAAGSPRPAAAAAAAMAAAAARHPEPDDGDGGRR
jgi:glutathione S-transferase